MLGKQWLNRYASIDMRGSAIERSQNRQRKLDGIVSWYFGHVMESLPLMLQLALLLLGCGLSLYLWGINTTVARVVVGITSFGVGFYVFIIIAGMAFRSCPYQTPGALILRHTAPLIQRMFHSTFSYVTKNFSCIAAPVNWWDSIQRSGWTVFHLTGIPGYAVALPFLLAHDACISVRPMIMVVLTFPRRVHSWVHSPWMDGSVQQAVALDLQCISWILQTSLDKAVHLSTLKSFAAMKTLVDFNPTLVSACFDILAGCVAVVGGKAVITQGSEELAALSDLCCLRAISHLATMDPTSRVLKDIRKRYTATFPLEANFEGFPSCLSFAIVLGIPYSPQLQVQRKDYRLLSNERVISVQLPQLEHQKNQHGKVPRWFLRFALHHLGQDPPPPTSVIIDCLSIIAVDMGCTLSATTALDERYVHIGQMLTCLIEN